MSNDDHNDSIDGLTKTGKSFDQRNDVWCITGRLSRVTMRSIN